MPLTRTTFRLSAALLIRRSTNIPSMTRRISAAGEVIEDSEPEREERRRQEMEERKRKTFVKPQSTREQDVQAVIELSDDSSNDVNLISSAFIGRNNVQAQGKLIKRANSSADIVIDISDDDLLPSPAQVVPSGMPNVFQNHLQRPVNNVSKTILSKSPPMTSDSETEPEDDNRMGLSRFTYQNPSRSQPASLSRTSSIVVVPKPAADIVAKPRKGRRAVQHRFTADFSDAQLATLAKCVCCGIGWTARKGVAQKMAHVQSCAKKFAFTDETVKVLMRKEIDRTLAENPGTKAKGKGKAIDPENLLPEVAKTYLEDLVGGAKPKRKGRHSQITVKKVVETREFTLDKARVILGNHVLPNTSDVGGPQCQNRGFEPSCLVDQDAGTWEEPPATQAFGESALRHRQAADGGVVRKRSVFDAASTDYEEASLSSIPPSTQNFGPSKLAGLHGPANSSPHSQTVISLDSSLTPHSARLVSSLSHIDLVSSSSRDPSPRCPLRKNSWSDDSVGAHLSTQSHFPASPLPRSPTVTEPMNRQDAGEGSNKFHNVYEQRQQQYEDEFSWDDDGAILHFDPHIEGQKQHQSTYIDLPIYSDGSDIGGITSTRFISVSKSKKSTARKSVAVVHSDVSSYTRKRRTKKSAHSNQRATSDIDPPLNEEWEAKLKESIIQDKELHLRILRYEPIHFAIFLQKATNNDNPSGRLKFALCSFLDKQAINFYGAEPFSGRGRR